MTAERRNIMFCKYCGKENSDDAKFCSSCGKAFSDMSAENNPQSSPASQGTGIPILSLIFGICSIPTAFLALWFSLLCSITAIVLGKISIKQEKGDTDYAEWGIRLGAIGLGLCVLFIIIHIISVIGIFSMITDVMPEIPSISR